MYLLREKCPISFVEIIMNWFKLGQWKTRNLREKNGKS